MLPSHLFRSHQRWPCQSRYTQTLLEHALSKQLKMRHFYQSSWKFLNVLLSLVTKMSLTGTFSIFDIGQRVFPNTSNAINDASNDGNDSNASNRLSQNSCINVINISNFVPKCEILHHISVYFRKLSELKCDTILDTQVSLALTHVSPPVRRSVCPSYF